MIELKTIEIAGLLAATKEYFDQGCQRFERECKGIIRTSEGKTIVHPSLFDEI